MKIYIAAPYAARAQVRRYADQLTRIGFTCTMRWTEETHEINDGTTGAATALTDDEVAGHAADDLRDVERADLFVLLTAQACGLAVISAASGGRHVETGYFIAKDRGANNVYVVGEPENIFHRLYGVNICATWHDAVLALAARLVKHERALPQELCR